MADDFFYSPHHKPAPSAQPKPRVPLWKFQHNGALWAVELVFHGESWGWEAQFLKRGELVIGRRFDTRALAVQWAEEERRALVGE